MTNPNAEAQRRWRERAKEKRKDNLKKVEKLATGDLFKTPFFEALARNANWSNVEIALDCGGMEAPDFSDDRGPASLSGQVESVAASFGEEPFGGGRNSLDRAEVLIGSWIDAAVELSQIVNSYKRREIGARIAEIEQNELADPALRKQAMAEIVRLTKMLEKLDKQIRWSFCQWKVADG